MARGIISTILGGVAGGFEGLAADQKRMRERADREREREEERRRMEAQFAFQAALSGATPGARLRTDEAAVAEQRLRDTPVSRVMDQAPLFEEPSEAPVGRSALDAALQARMPRPDFAAERPATTRVTPVTEEEDYFQLTSPGGQVFSMMTPEARIRREQETAQSASQEENMMAYRTLASVDPNVGEYDSGIDYGRMLDRAIRMEEIEATRPPRGEAESALMRNFNLLREKTDLPDEEILGMLLNRPIGGSPNEQAFREAMQRFAGQREPGLGGIPGDFPSERQIREYARRIAPSYGVGQDLVDQIYPERRPPSQSFGAAANPQLIPSGTRDYYEEEFKPRRP